MDRNIRYQVLQEERDDDEENTVVSETTTTTTTSVRHGTNLTTRPFSSLLQPTEDLPSSGVAHSNPTTTDDLALPPAYEDISGTTVQQQQEQPNECLQQGAQCLKTNQITLGDPSCAAGLPPSYAVATDLPSYEEAERLKREEEEEGDHDGILGVGCRAHPPLHHHHHLRALPTDEEHIHLEDGPDQVPSTSDRLNGSGMTVGTDWIFFCTFVMSFLFNWLGFLMSLCITNTVAGRCGALAGLGLSMVKWVAIVKHSGFAGDLAAGESWFWWILMLCGFLLFIRGCMQYVHVKYEWKRITGRLHHFYLF